MVQPFVAKTRTQHTSCRRPGRGADGAPTRARPLAAAPGATPACHPCVPPGPPQRSCPPCRATRKQHSRAKRAGRRATTGGEVKVRVSALCDLQARGTRHGWQNDAQRVRRAGCCGARTATGARRPGRRDAPARRGWEGCERVSGARQRSVRLARHGLAWDGLLMGRAAGAVGRVLRRAHRDRRGATLASR